MYLRLHMTSLLPAAAFSLNHRVPSKFILRRQARSNYMCTYIPNLHCLTVPSFRSLAKQFQEALKVAPGQVKAGHSPCRRREFWDFVDYPSRRFTWCWTT